MRRKKREKHGGKFVIANDKEVIIVLSFAVKF